MCTTGSPVLVTLTMKINCEVRPLHYPRSKCFSNPVIRYAEHRISGDVLCLLDSEGLKSIGVSTIGQRLAILKAVYQTKLAHNVPIEDDHYVPPCKSCL